MSLAICPVPMISGSQHYDYTFEDRTGRNDNSDWDDIYERLFFRVAHAQEGNTINIYDVGYRMRRRDNSHLQLQPVVVLEFDANQSLGKITYATELYRRSFSMSRYLKKTTFFGGSLIRKFTGSDGKEYKWSHKIVEGQQWTCTTGQEENIVAHYDLLPEDSIAYRISGNNLVVRNRFAALSLEYLATLTIMRHIAQHNL
ncbi:hypothetical protein AX17_004045 [Amanita inopinata Kibby_2008]|nr:hypothetical protein AX17_004045 [Amanita inopinata Kibby_2008]